MKKRVERKERAKGDVKEKSKTGAKGSMKVLRASMILLGAMCAAGVETGAVCAGGPEGYLASAAGSEAGLARAALPAIGVGKGAVPGSMSGAQAEAAAAARAGAAGAASPSGASLTDEKELILQLTDPSCEGRYPGTAGIDKAAEIVAGRFDHAGLKPAGDNGTWFQSFTDPKFPGATLRNVVGILPGSAPNPASGGFVVIGAHYDHLGRDEKLALTPGADDNASGVAALCAIAQELVADPSPHRRSILFISFSGEEEGLLGSRWYVAHPIEPLEATVAMICLDTIGRMQANRLLALNASSAAELSSALHGVNLGFGLDLAVPEKGPFGSDQLSFIEKGIPAFQLCTDPNADYHRSSDTPDKLNYEGIASIAAFTAEVARFLADRDRPLTFVAPAAAKATLPAGAATASGRRASLGTIPDFSGTDTAPGVPINGVLPGSPAEKAGLQKGDRITAIDGEKISDIEDFTAVLKSHAPGDKVRVTFVRGGKEQTVEATLAERK